MSCGTTDSSTTCCLEKFDRHSSCVIANYLSSTALRARPLRGTKQNAVTAWAVEMRSLPTPVPHAFQLTLPFMKTVSSVSARADHERRYPSKPGEQLRSSGSCDLRLRTCGGGSREKNARCVVASGPGSSFLDNTTPHTLTLYDFRLITSVTLITLITTDAKPTIAAHTATPFCACQIATTKMFNS